MLVRIIVPPPLAMLYCFGSFCRERGTTPVYERLKATDPEVYAAIEAERQRQESKIELIASENFVS